MNNSIRIGSLRTTLDGDSRYTDIINVYVLEDDSVQVKVTTSVPQGGWDACNGNTHTDVYSLREFPKDALAKDILKYIKGVCANTNLNFKRYGKPTKNFSWIDSTSVHGAYGLNLKNLQNALGLARQKG